MNRLDGKVALVTGAGQGIGEAIAKTLGREGALVWCTDIDEQAAEATVAGIANAGGEARTFALDVTDESAWNALAETFESGSLSLDVLVHNAGMEWVVPLADIELSDWRRVMSVNVESVYLGCRKLLPALKRSGARHEAGASVVNISSIAGMVGYPDQSAYNTSKAAVRHLSKSLAIEFAAHEMNIRVNSVHPGCVDTPMLQEAMEAWAETEAFGTRDLAEVRKQVAALHPLNKLAHPDDIASGVLYLASDEARFVTGAELAIDGGWTAR